MVADKPTSEKHDLLASLIAQLNDFVVVICDADGVIRSWHEGIQSQFGYSAADFVAVFLPPGFFAPTFFGGAGSPAFRPSPVVLAKEERWAE